MSAKSILPAWFTALACHEKAAIAATVALAFFLVIDPLVYETVRGFDPGTYQAFRSFTDLGRSNWLLIPSGILILILAWWRSGESSDTRSVRLGYYRQLLVYLFLTIALTGLASSLLKNIIGRARPKLYDSLGPIEFQPFTFDSDFASFPSGHATTAGALAMLLALIFPRARVLLLLAGGWIASTRFLIGAHYISDSFAGYLFGCAGALFIAQRMAVRRYLFELASDGSLRLRGRRVLGRLVTPVTELVERLKPDALRRVG